MSRDYPYKYLSPILEVLISEHQTTLIRTQTDLTHSIPDLQNQRESLETHRSEEPLRFSLLVLDISPSLLDLDTFTEMKGQFSIEWLSQSSQASCSETPARPSNPWMCAGQEGPSASGTASESLPGFYGRWRAENTDNQEIHTAQPGNSSLCTSTQHTASDNSSQQHTHVSEPGFGSSSTEEEETSGYESEGGRSLSPGALKEPAPSVSPSTGRRPRTAFTAEQINSLERAFKRNAYLGAQDKADLCKKLSLSDKQIRNWFQNRRMKLKRTVQDSLAHACQAKVASHMMHYSDLHSFRPAPYPSYYPGVQESSVPFAQCPPAFHYSPATAAGLPTLPVDTLYQYSTLQSLPVHASNPSMMATYQPYHSQYYNTQ